MRSFILFFVGGDRFFDLWKAIPAERFAIALLIPKSDRLSFIKVILPEWDRFFDLRKAIPAERFAIALRIPERGILPESAIATS